MGGASAGLGRKSNKPIGVRKIREAPPPNKWEGCRKKLATSEKTSIVTLVKCAKSGQATALTNVITAAHEHLRQVS